jgi:predicted RNase H-like HicB family nuclease
MRRYIALIETSREHRLAARVPDFPGVSSMAPTLRELRDSLSDSLALAIEERERGGEPLPEPSSFEALMAANADHAAMLIAPKRKKAVAPTQARAAEPLHALSNDEWPEADA